MRLIDADALLDKINVTIFAEDRDENVACTMVEDAPTVEPSGDLISRAKDDIAKYRTWSHTVDNLCQDLINRADAIEALVKYVADGFAESENDFDAYMNIIKDFPSADITSTEECIKCQEVHDKVLANACEKIPRWIPVTERLPEHDMDVLLTYITKGEMGMHCGVETHFHPVKRICIDKVEKDRDDTMNGHRFSKDIIAWMPLPKPYGGDGE